MQGHRDKNVTRVRINFAQIIGAVGEWYMKRQALAECVDRTEKTKEKRRFAEKIYFCNAKAGDCNYDGLRSSLAGCCAIML